MTSFHWLTGNSNTLCPVRPLQTAIGRCWRTATHWDIAGERARPGCRFRRRAGNRPECARPGRCNATKPSGIGLANARCHLDIAAAEDGRTPSARRVPAAVDFSPANLNAKAQRRRDAKKFWFSLRLGAFASWRLISLPRPSNCSNAIRPPQTAIGRPARTLLGSAPVPVAVFGVAPKTARSAPVPGRSNAAKQAVIGLANARRSLDIAVAEDGHTPPRSSTPNCLWPGLCRQPPCARPVSAGGAADSSPR